jgi:O-antigen/teichoic acid export membrane protein
LINLFKKIFSNLFHLGFIQATNIVLQLLLIPLVISRVGLAANGLVLTALSLAGLLSIFINYAGSQTLPVLLDGLTKHGRLQDQQDGLTKHGRLQDQHIAEEISGNMVIRLLAFAIVSTVIGLIHLSDWPFGIYLLCIVPLLFSEVLNPHAFLLSLGKIKYFNYVNLLSRSLALLLIWSTLVEVEQAPWVNAWVGMLLSAFYLVLWSWMVKKRWVHFGRLNPAVFVTLVSRQARLVGANLVVHLQQSVFLYGLGLTSSPAVLGVYSVLDKLVSGARMALVAFSNAIYPFAITTFNGDVKQWYVLRKKVNRFFWVFLLIVGTIIFLTAPWLASLLADDVDSTLLVDYIRWMGLIPLLIALNALNVMELLMKKKFDQQFSISLRLLTLSLASSALFLAPFYLNSNLISPALFIPYLPVYLIFMESMTLLLYERNRNRTR